MFCFIRGQVQPRRIRFHSVCLHHRGPPRPRRDPPLSLSRQSSGRPCRAVVLLCVPPPPRLPRSRHRAIQAGRCHSRGNSRSPAVCGAVGAIGRHYPSWPRGEYTSIRRRRDAAVRRALGSDGGWSLCVCPHARASVRAVSAHTRAGFLRSDYGVDDVL